MNVLFLQRLDQAGGGSRASLRTTLHALRSQRPDWRLALATANSGPLSQQAGDCGVKPLLAPMPHFRNHLQRPAYWLACRRLATQARTFQPDVILSNEWVTAPHAWSVGRRLGVPAMSYVRDFAALERGRKYQLHRMDRLLCVCESMRQGLISAGYDPQKVRTVYNPVLRPQIHAADPSLRETIANHAGVDRWLLYLGRISRRKNQIAAVEVLRHLRNQTGQRWGLLLAGDADDAYAAEVRQFGITAGLGNAILELGMITHPGWLFEVADASILTSKSEGLARVLIESFLSATPGFSLPLDGLEDIYGGDLTFFVPTQPTPEALAMRIATALENPQHCNEHTERLRMTLEQRHSLASHVASLETALAG